MAVMTGVSTFFSPPPTIHRELVFVGKKANSEFRSIAAAILDNFLVHPQLSKELLAKIIDNHFKYFRTHNFDNSPLITPSTHIKNLLMKLPRAEVVCALAFTLRQMTIDYMVSNLPEYIDCFVQNGCYLPSNKLRSPDFHMDSHISLRALALSLNIPIEIRTLETGKELLAPPFNCNKKSEHQITNPKLIIVLKEGSYHPNLVQFKPFVSETYDSCPITYPEHTNSKKACSEKEVQETFELKTDQLKNQANHTESALKAYLTAGDCGLEDLLNIFIQLKTQPQPNLGQIENSNSPENTHEEDLSQWLIKAIAAVTCHNPILADEALEKIGGTELEETPRLPHMK